MTRKPISSPAFKYISGVRRMTEVHFQPFTLKKLYIFGVEDDSLCIYCQENESTMYLVEWFKKKWFNNKNAFAFSPTGFSQNVHLGKSLSRQILQQKLWISPSSLLITIKPSLKFQFCVTLVYRFACEYYESKGIITIFIGETTIVFATIFQLF